MGPEELRILYGEFNAGKKPFEVIADRGYHPDIVEFEYHRFMRLPDRDICTLLKTIIADCEGYSKPADRLTFLIKKYYNEGYLSNDDIYELIKLRIEHESQSRLESLMHNSIDPLLEGIVMLKCNVCKMPLPGACWIPGLESEILSSIKIVKSFVVVVYLIDMMKCADSIWVCHRHNYRKEE